MDQNWVCDKKGGATNLWILFVHSIGCLWVRRRCNFHILNSYVLYTYIELLWIILNVFNHLSPYNKWSLSLSLSIVGHCSPPVCWIWVVSNREFWTEDLAAVLSKASVPRARKALDCLCIWFEKISDCLNITCTTVYNNVQCQQKVMGHLDIFPLNPIVTKSCKLECCGNKIHQIFANMM